MTVKLVPVGDLEPAAYNPREADPQRLDFIRISIRKLGFILPLYANQSGHLLSGHQRLIVAQEIGYSHVPVTLLEVPEHKVQQFNVMFNRATNDMTVNESGDSLLAEIDFNGLMELAASLPDIDPDDPRACRALEPEMVSISDLVGMVRVRANHGVMATAFRLMASGAKMPLVICGERIVNGEYRAMAAASAAATGSFGMVKGGSYPVIRVTDAEHEFSRVMLNKISMTFTLENQYRDRLRYGAFRRNEQIHDTLLPTFRYMVDGRWTSLKQGTYYRKPEEFWRRWPIVYGKSVADVGAGQRRIRPMLEEHGIRVIEWEPYACDWQREVEGSKANVPSLTLSRRLSAAFLEDVASGTQYDTVALPSVLNSIPFSRERVFCIAMCHALLGYNDQLVGVCRNAGQRSYVINSKMGPDGSYERSPGGFVLSYEKGIRVAEISRTPKIQKHHTKAEVIDLIGGFFKVPFVDDKSDSSIFFRGRFPKKVNPRLLKTALISQFSLPYPEGQSLDMAAEALAAYGQRLKIDFDKVEAFPDAD